MTDLRRSKRIRSQSNVVTNNLQQGHRKASANVLKRGRDVSAIDVDQHTPKRLRLTESNLRRYERSLRGIASTRESVSTSTATTTDKQFGNRLRANGVVYEGYSTCAPKDEVELVAFLIDQTHENRPTPTRQSWERIKFLKEDGGSKLTLESLIVDSILVAHDMVAPSSYARFRNEQWTEADDEITAGISDPKPDVMETYYWHAYPAQTRDDFEELVISQYGYAMPTFALESKGSAGDYEQAVRQAAYDGAVMTHAALAIDGHLDKGPDILFNTTKAITVTLSATHIHVYANHAVKAAPPSSKIAYHQYELMEVRYITSEAEWHRAHVVLFNAQRLGLRLAQSRLRDLEEYYRAKEQKDKQLKAKQTKLQAEAYAKTARAMGPPPLKRVLKANVKHAVRKDIDATKQSPRDSIPGLATGRPLLSTTP